MAEIPARHTSIKNTGMVPNRDGDMVIQQDPESQNQPREKKESPEKASAFRSLGWLDRFLAVWILLAMVIGVLLGNFVPQTGPALQKGKFVGVSIPIGMFGQFPKICFVGFRVP